MKKVKLLSVILLAGICFVACKKDKKEDISLKNYLKVENASFVDGTMPSETPGGACDFSDLTGNSNILAGGANQLLITSSSNITAMMVSIKDVKGYFKLDVTSAKSQYYRLPLLFESNLPKNVFTIQVALCEGTTVSEWRSIDVATIHAGTGKLQVSITWDQLNDVDLHLYEPNQGEHIYYAHRISDAGGELDVDSNPACSIDGINNENITYKDTSNVTVPAGEYEVWVHLWSNCSIPDNTNYVVTARFNGQLIQPTFGTNPYHGFFKPEDYGTEEGLVNVMKFNTSQAKAAGLIEERLQFNFGKSSDNEVAKSKASVAKPDMPHWK